MHRLDDEKTVYRQNARAGERMRYTIESFFQITRRPRSKFYGGAEPLSGNAGILDGSALKAMGTA